jgi:signal transduction histidine kinase
VKDRAPEKPVLFREVFRNEDCNKLTRQVVLLLSKSNPRHHQRAQEFVMAETRNLDAALISVAYYLAARRETILERWRKAVEGDPQLASHSFLSTAEFYDHIPAVLDAFERELCAQQRTETVEAEDEEKEGAADHGLHRWRFGYNQNEVIREWGHLHFCLVDELEVYARTHCVPEDDVMPYARRALARLCNDGINESVTRYARVQQMEAAGRVRDLEQALAQLKELEQQRAGIWREAAHDLRGNVGVVKSLIDLVHRENPVESRRSENISVLQRSITSLHTLLDDLLTLSRVEAGQDQRKIESFDAAMLLRELCTSTKPLAAERGLSLEANGPAALPVQGDPAKTHRIAQNLLLNALKYTERGGVRVAWAEHEAEGFARWTMCIQDTGSGFQSGSAEPLTRALRESTEDTPASESAAKGTEKPTAREEPGLVSESARRPAYEIGEGIGLSIVRRLCELLDAGIEVEAEPGKGSTFRIIFPRYYDLP